MFFEWSGNKLQLKPGILGVEAFRKIWERDKDDEKGQAMMIFCLLYFMHDPRSEYMFETDEKTRMAMIKEYMGAPENIDRDKLYLSAVPVYVHLTETTASRVLQVNREIVEKIRNHLREVKIDDDNLDKVVKATSGLTDLSVKIAKSEREIYRDVDERLSRVLGDVSLTIGDEAGWE
jgi:hypothetical protein